MSTKSNRDFRPGYHYTPPKGWINDPNGLTYVDGIWHLFAQHYPNDAVWGPMHWIHAESRDLISWQDKGISLYPDEKLGLIFSGSAVIDKGNSSGLGKDCDPMICMYTSHGEYEQQSIAFSCDRVHFTPYSGNPVIPNTDKPDFRDPKVFRNEILNCWSVAIAAGDHVEFYSSDNLIDWNKTGEFGAAENTLGGVFECPDVFALNAPDGSKVWILIASMALPGEFGGSRTQYFIGRFNGKTFTQTIAHERALLIDSGYDNYASVSFSGTDETILLGWANSWVYADKEPTNDFCGAMAYARRVSLVDTNDGLRLAFSPITPEFAMSHAAHNSLPITREAFKIHIESKGAFMLSIKNELGDVLRIGLDNEQRFVVDRTHGGICAFSDLFHSGLMSVMLTPRLMRGSVSMDIYFDHFITEVFADNGVYANTTLVFPQAPYTTAEIIGNAKMWVGFPNC